MKTTKEHVKERNEMDGMQLERRRDNQKWIYDWLVKETGRTHCFEYPQRQVPTEVKTYEMIPASMFKKGNRIEALAREAEKAGDLLTARSLYYKAVQKYHLGQHAIFEEDNDDKAFIRSHMEACFDRVMALGGHPMELVEIPWEGVTIQGVMHYLPGRPKAPVCLIIPGIDMVKENAFDPESCPFLDRGMHVLVIDGPGQGVSVMRKIWVTDNNYERAASACVTWLTKQPEVEADKIAAFGIGTGTFWGMRLLALDDRLAAGAEAAACYAGVRYMTEMASPRSKQIFMFVSGMRNEDEFDTMAAKMNLTGYAEQIKSPTLMTVGEYDMISPLNETLEVFDSIGAPKELWVFENGFHGGVREGLANLADFDLFCFIADWLLKAMNKKLPAGLNVRRLLPESGANGPYGNEVTDFALRSRYECQPALN